MPTTFLNESLEPRFTMSQQQVQLSARCPVRVQPLLVTSDVQAHDHDYYEIGVIRGGTAWHCTAGDARTLSAGAVYVMAPGSVHALRRIRRLAITNVYYLNEWLLTELRALWDVDGLVPLFLASGLFRSALPVLQFPLTAAELASCERELHDIATEAGSVAPSLVFLKAAVLKLLTGLSRAYTRDSGRTPGFAFRREVWHALERVEQCLVERRPFRVEKIARECDVSVNRLRREFRSATGWSPLEYFQRRRIQHACALLLNRQLSVTQVAQSLGFADAAHLCRLFRRHRGLSPRQYCTRYSIGPPRSE